MSGRKYDDEFWSFITPEPLASIEDAFNLYYVQKRWSIAKLAQFLGVASNTLRVKMINSGIKIRNQYGRDRK